jgi:NAD(P)-dependent dehydrogenase (short-subunit alcohol dehydrogenase family)
MDRQWQGKTAIVTGGSAGIGLAIARVLAEEGVEVTIPGRNRQKLDAAIASLPGVVHGIEADLGTAAGAMTLIAQVPETDILVNHLGLYESKPFADIRRSGGATSRSLSSAAFGWRATTFPRCCSETGDASLLSPAKPPPRPIPTCCTMA